MSQNTALIQLGQTFQRDYQAWLSACGVGREGIGQLENWGKQLAQNMEWRPETMDEGYLEQNLAAFFGSGFEQNKITSDPLRADESEPEPSSLMQHQKPASLPIPQTNSPHRSETRSVAGPTNAPHFEKGPSQHLTATLPRTASNQAPELQPMQASEKMNADTPMVEASPKRADSSPGLYATGAASQIGRNKEDSLVEQVPPSQPQALQKSEFQPIRNIGDWAAQVKLSAPQAIRPEPDDERSRTIQTPLPGPPPGSRTASKMDNRSNPNRKSAYLERLDAPPHPTHQFMEGPHQEQDPLGDLGWSPLPDKKGPLPTVPTGWNSREDSLVQTETTVPGFAASKQMDFTQQEMKPMSTAFYPTSQQIEIKPAQVPESQLFFSVPPLQMNTEEILQALTEALTEEYRRYYGHL